MLNRLALVAAIITLSSCILLRAEQAADQARQIQPLVSDGSVTGYRLAWHDEFDGEKLNDIEWACRTDSKMWSTQRPENISIKDGKLVLHVKKEQAAGKQYTGAGVISRRTFMYGYYEARMKVPRGAGWHTAFWMMRHDRSGAANTTAAAQELDVFENDSVDLTRYVVKVHHWNPPPHQPMGEKTIRGPDFAADFHVLGCEFTPDKVKYYCDGNIVQTVNVSQLGHGYQNIWLTTIASSLGETQAVDDGKLPSTAEYDYVRFFEKR